MTKKSKSLDSSNTINLKLTLKERKLLLDLDIALPHLLERIAITPATKWDLHFNFTPEELDQFAGFILDKAEETMYVERKNELNRIYDRIDNLLKACGFEKPKYDNTLASIIGDIKENEYSNIEEFEQVVIQRLQTYNLTPQPELGGLSPVQVQFLCQSDWSDHNAVIKFNKGLALDKLQGATIFNNCRAMLSAIAKADGVKLTKTGNLNRNFIKEMLGVMVISKDSLDRLLTYNKVINEDDCFEVHIPRILLEMAGLVRKYKGNLKVSKRGKELLAENKAGQLFNLLFLTLYRKLNLFYLTRFQEIPGYQDTIGFPIYMTGQLCSDWTKPESIARKVLLPIVLEKVPKTPLKDNVEWLVKKTVVEPLVGFGLLESRELTKEDDFTQPIEVRKSILFDEFLNFDLTPTQTFPKTEFLH